MTTLILLAILAQPMDSNFGLIEVCGPGGCTFTGTVALGDDVDACFGAGTDYCLRYDSTATQFEVWSTDTDGAGADGNVITIDDGTNDVTVTGNLQAVVLLPGTQADPADSGAIRLDNDGGGEICWESDPAGTDKCMTVTSGEVWQFAGSGNFQGDLYVNGGSLIYWTGRATLKSPATGQMEIDKSDGSAGVTLDGATQDTLTIKDEAGTGVGHLTAQGALTLGAPVNPGDANYTTLASSQWIAYQTACTVDRTVTLDDDHCVNGRYITVSDAGCLAGAANNLVVDGETTSTINGVATFSLTTDYESIDVYCLDGSGGAGAKKWVIR